MIYGFIMIQTEIPSLTDIQVLSPLAWVQKESERIAAIYGRKCMPLTLRELDDCMDRVDSVIGAPHFPYAEEDQRRLEWYLIQLSATAIAMLQQLREP